MVETKFKLGDKVSAIRRGSLTRTEHSQCPVCCEPGATPGKVTMGGEVFDCPKCRGRKTVETQGWGWYVEHASTVVVRVSVDVWLPEDADDPGREIRYMLRASSSGRSGSLMQENELVDGDRAAAQAECDRRNAGGEYD